MLSRSPANWPKKSEVTLTSLRRPFKPAPAAPAGARARPERPRPRPELSRPAGRGRQGRNVGQRITEVGEPIAAAHPGGRGRDLDLEARARVEPEAVSAACDVHGDVPVCRDVVDVVVVRAVHESD